MKVLLLSLVLVLSACATKQPVAIPADTKVEVDKFALEPCRQPEMLKSSKDVDNLDFTVKNLELLAECARKQSILSRLVKKLLNQD